LKRSDLVRELIEAGCQLYRHGRRHDLFIHTKTGRKAPVPRHAEIRESLCELIRRQLGLKKRS